VSFLTSGDLDLWRLQLKIGTLRTGALGNIYTNVVILPCYGALEIVDAITIIITIIWFSTLLFSNYKPVGEGTDGQTDGKDS